MTASPHWTMSGLSTILANLGSARLHDRSNLGTMWIHGSRGKSPSGRRSRRPAPRRPPKSSLLMLVARPRVWIRRASSDLLARAIRTTVGAAAARRVGCPQITSHATPAAWSTRGPERAQKHLDRPTARPAHLSRMVLRGGITPTERDLSVPDDGGQAG